MAVPDSSSCALASCTPPDETLAHKLRESPVLAGNQQTRDPNRCREIGRDEPGRSAEQQPRPDLIFRPDWLEHPNGALGICQVTIMAER
jgi:hypothetical protein